MRLIRTVPIIFTIPVLIFTVFLLNSYHVPTARAATSVVLTAYGSQIDTMSIPSTAQYVGGGFSMVSSGSTTITKFVLRESGTVSDTDLSNVQLFYDFDTTAPYDCASETFNASDSVFGFATNFSASTASYTGSIAIGPTQSVCLYPVLDVQNSATNGETMEIQVLPADIIVSGDFDVVASGSIPTAVEPIVGTTVMILPPPSVVSVFAVGTQVSTVVAPSEKQYIGGAFGMIPDTGSTNIKQIPLSVGGTINGLLDLTQVHLYYDLDTSSPYDCASETYSGSEPEFGSSTSFSSLSKADFSGSVTVTSTQAACFYPVFNIESTANDGNTIEIIIKDPDSSIVVEVGGTVGTVSDVNVSGTTIVEATPEFGVTVTSFGVQVALLNATGANQYIGGGFRLTAQSGTPSITKVTFSIGGTVGALAVDTLQMHYDFDTTSPYDCTSESYASSDPLYGSIASTGFSKTVLLIDEIEIGPSKVLCLYPVVTMNGGIEGRTFEAILSRPSTNIIASGGATVTPSTDVAITGTTVISEDGGGDPEPVIVNDGDLIRAEGDYRVYIVRIVGSKKFIRHIVHEAVFTFYGHFNFEAVKDVPNLDAYTLSAWVRVVGTASVYEINADGSAHHITCDDDTGQGDGSCTNEWLAVGGDPDGIYDINSGEMGWYTITNPVVLPDIID